MHLHLHGQSVAAVQPSLWYQQQHIGLYSVDRVASVRFAAPTMAAAPTGVTLEQAHAAVTRQGDAVRSLKAAVKEGNAQKVRLVCRREHVYPSRAGEVLHVHACWVRAPSNINCPISHLQADVDAAIQKLKDLKLEAEKLQKVSAWIRAPSQCQHGGTLAIARDWMCDAGT